MFSCPIDEITYKQVHDFCLQQVEEGIRLDYKADFPKDLAKLLASFANTYGGMILVGVDEKGRKPVLPITGVLPERGLAERVISIGLTAVNPPVIPEVKVCPFRSMSAIEDDRAVVVIRVHQSDQTPHAIENKTKVYLRVDSQSQPFDLATTDQIELLLSRREKPLQLRKKLEELMVGHCSEAWASQAQIAGWSASPPFFTNTIRAAPVFPGGVGGPHVPPDALLRIRTRAPLVPPRIPGGGISHDLHRVEGGVAAYSIGQKAGWYSEVNEHGLMLYQERTASRTLYVDEVGTSTLNVLRYALSLYRHVGFFGLFDLELQLEGLSRRTLGEDTPYRSVDNLITIQHRATVDEFIETEFRVITRMVNRLRWAFDLDELTETAVKAMLT